MRVLRKERNATYHLILLHCVEQTPWGVSEHSETIIALPPAIDNEWKRNINKLTLQYTV